MTRRSFAEDLEEAAATIGDRSIPDIQTLLRRAALRIRNAPALTFDEPVEAALLQVMQELDRSRDATLRIIVLDWLVSYGRLPVQELEEDSQTEGEA